MWHLVRGCSFKLAYVCLLLIMLSCGEWVLAVHILSYLLATVCQTELLPTPLPVLLSTIFET